MKYSALCGAAYAAYWLVSPLTVHGAPSDDLLSYWKFEGNLNDSATGGAVPDTGTWVSGANYTNTSPLGQGILLTGANYVSVPSSADLVRSGGSLTISAWFRVDNWNTNWQALISKGEGTNYRLARNAGDANQIAYAGGSGDITGGTVNDGQWHHVAAVSELGEGTFLYVDGLQVAEGASPGITDSGLPLLMGENPGATNRRWIGGIDDVGIFRQPVSPLVIGAIHRLGNDVAFRYTLGQVMELVDAHATGPGATKIMGPTTWVYAASDPGGTAIFVELGTNGSGMAVSTGPTIVSFGASPVFITGGEMVTLSWSVTPPFTSISIDQGIGSVLAQTNGAGVGSITVTPAVSTIYTLSVSNAQGTNQTQTSVFVNEDPTAPRISEFLASASSGGLKDEDGMVEDWIEIHAPGPNASDLAGYYLTDDATNLRKWAFPALLVPGHSYLVVFASAKDRIANPAFLHTNFRLSASGEYLALTRDNGMGGVTVVNEFAPAFPAQREDISYGLGSDGLTVGYMATPTPRAANGNAAVGFVADTVFSVNRGFFNAPVSLEITTATPGSSIRYTTNGTTPSESVGTLYAGPIAINKTTTIRAMAYLSGYFPTNVDTNTYLFPNDIRTQNANGAAPPGWPTGSVNGQVYDYGMDPDITNRYTAQQMMDALTAIPTMSVVTDQGNLTSASTGIYSNPGSHGQFWERPTSLELINPDGSTGFQIDCGIRTRGGFSRSTGNPKHAFRFFFRGEYGDGKLNFPLFGNEGADQFDKFDLRTSQNYSWAFQGDPSNTFLREVLGRDLQGALGQPHTRSRYYHLYLNGVYWGLYMTEERAEANYGETYFKGTKDDFDTAKSAGSSGGYNTEATDGTITQGTAGAPGSDWAAQWFTARDQFATPTLARYLQLQGLNPDGSRNPALPVYLDVDNLADYMLCIGYTGNYDAPLSDFVGASNNWFAVRNRVRDDKGFAYFVHDGEHTMGAGGKWAGANNRISTSNGSGDRGNYIKSNPHFVHYDLAGGTSSAIGAVEYRLRFADRAHKALFNNGVLTRDAVTQRMESRRAIVDRVIIAEAARWGDAKVATPFDKPTWVNAVNALQGVINTRSDVFLGQLRGALLYPNIDAPVFSRPGGPVAGGSSIVISNTSGQVYYTTDGSDPRLLGGAANPGASVIDGSLINVNLFGKLAVWKFRDDGSDQGSSALVAGAPGYGASNWKSPSHDDSDPMVWKSGPGVLGYGAITGATIATQVSFGGNAGNRHITTYFRRSFEVQHAGLFTELSAQVLRDDGVIIYLNGREAGRSNMPGGEILFNSLAPSAGATEGDYQTVMLDPALLVEGTNVLAVELHQETPGSSDLGFDMALSGIRANDLNTGIPINVPTQLRARSYNSATQEWSALNEAFYTTGVPASSANLALSKVHYHPAPPTPQELANPAVTSADDFEFVEVLNFSNDIVELGGASFVLRPVNDHLEGITFTFANGTLLMPGERRVVVSNAAAFPVRYPAVSPTLVSGEYQNRLDNSGEWITLNAADGSLIVSFRYNDLAPWPTEADGGGPALVLKDPGGMPDYALGESWRASATDGGSPGSLDGLPFVGDPLADNDKDGVVALIEYYLGTSDSVPSAELLPLPGVVEIAGQFYLSLTFRHDPLAVDATGLVEQGGDLQGWGGGTVFVSSVDGPGDVMLDTWRSTTPLSTESSFLRLRVSLIP